MLGTQLSVRSICFGFLLSLSFSSLIYQGSYCENTTQQPLTTAYKTNVERILSLMISDAATSKGYNYTTIGNNNTVYGLYDCRRDVVGYFCQFCVSNAALEIPQHCPNRVSAMVWYDFCILRYSNENFFGKVLTHPTWHAVGNKNISNKEETKKAEDFMRSLIRKATMETSMLYYVDGFNLSFTQSRYGLVQCTKDLTNDGCRECLEAMLAEVPKFCTQKLGWFIWSGTCMIKYDDYMFYIPNDQTSSIPVSNPETDKHGGNKRSKILIISFYVMGSTTLLCLGVYLFLYRRRDGIRRSSFHKIQTEEMLNTDLPIIPLITILRSTDTFSEAAKLGEGGFGSVYKGILPDGRQIAVKRLSEFSGQGSEEFNNEVMFIAKLQHRNLVRLYGCCLEEKEKILVYEYMPNSSLYFHLFDDEKRKQLDWKVRLSIINGIARGLLYLHEDSRLRVIHRDLKTSNVLLDHDMNPKISDFGLAKAFEIGQNQANTKRIMGTYGYMAPEYAMQGLFSVKSDVFSFGVLVLETICGRKNNGFYLSEHDETLLLYAWRIWCEGKCLELMDPMLEKSFKASEVEKCIHIALLCVQENATYRPTMSDVVVMLGIDKLNLPKPKHPAFSVGRKFLGDEPKSKRSKNLLNTNVTISITLPR
ncbi:cysteine-rich receptor-like protein kinase 10 [Vigna unguiculata]|uniref:cysteine-rich receptor-like protein kinase 10 n=1 Tax=Vigna unguiculata TaxID=3917 RepID=UPI001017100C|nr:cysteine-rich receptor-like protein kinase 10 [Vigna unguiculata]